MEHRIVDLYECHKQIRPRFTRFDSRLIGLLRLITEDAYLLAEGGSVGQPMHVEVESFISDTSDCVGKELWRIQSHIVRRVKEVYKSSNTNGVYANICIIGGAICISFMSSDIIFPKIQKLNYDVPWGSPQGTICVSHMDRIKAGGIRYVWCDDHEDCDITVGSKIYIVSHGLWELVDGVAISVDLDSIRNISTRTKSSNTVVTETNGPISTDVKVLPKVTADTSIIGGQEYHLIMSDGDYSDTYINRIDVTLVVRDDGSVEEYDVIINGIAFLITVSGLYIFEDGDLNKV